MTIAALCVFQASTAAAATTDAGTMSTPSVEVGVLDQAAGAPAGVTEPPVVVAWDSSIRPMQASNQTIDMRDDDQGYDSSYLFGMTKGVANSTMTPAFKPLVFLLTVPLDIVLLPFAAIGGFF
jgi:hypothetical protein